MKETAAPWAAWLWKGLKVIFVMIVVLGLAAPILVFGSFMLWDPDPRSDIRKVAGPLLQETGIRVLDDACSYPVELNISGRDFCYLTAFEIRWRDERMAVSEQLPNLPNWHMADVNVDDYFALASRVLWSDALIVSPPPGTVFEAWYYAPGKCGGNDHEPGTLYNEYLPGLPPCYEGLTRRHCSFTLAFYDADTGLFWHVSQHQ